MNYSMMKFKKTIFSLLAFCAVIALAAFALNKTPAKETKPRLSIITSVFNGDQFIRGFLENITSVNHFEDYELLLIHPPGPGLEESVIREYLPRFANIRYIKLESDPGIYGVWNLGAKMAQANFLTNANACDRRHPEMLDRHLRYLEKNPDVDLVYSDFIMTPVPNSDFATNKSSSIIRCDNYSPEKMYLCLPGPGPIWRKDVHNRFGYFRDDFIAAGDFEMWNRMAAGGAKMKKLPGIELLFYMNRQERADNISPEKAARREWENNYVKHAYSYLWDQIPEKEPLLLVLIPTRSRPERFFKQLDNYYYNLSGETRYCFLVNCDEDDETMNNPEVREKLGTYPNLIYTFQPGSTRIDAYNRNLSTTAYDILLAASEDLEPQVWGYDKKIIGQMKTHFPGYDGVLNYHDGYVGERCNIYPIAGRKFIARLGHFYHPEYTALCANEELTVISRILGKERIINEILLKHRHPAHGERPWDDLDRLREGFKDQDKQVFLNHKKNRFDLDDRGIFEKEWSILICTIDERKKFFNKLYQELQNQIAEAGLKDKIEVLYYRDNREKTIGFKRNELMRRARGKYMCFIDDDDEIHPGYIKMIYEKLQSNPDCVSITGIRYDEAGKPTIFDHSIKYGNGYCFCNWKQISPPGHLNPIKKVVAAQYLFPKINMREDCHWAMEIAKSGMLKKEANINTPYYFYSPSKFRKTTDMTKKDRELLVTGCARSGTTFMTQFLNKNKMDVGHEADGQDGVVSWVMAADSNTSPWGPPSNAYQFQHVLHQVRHPLKTIASAGNEPDLSWFYIQRFVPEIKLEDPKIVKGAKYWYYWNLLAEKKSEFTYRVEDLDCAVDEINNRLGLNLDKNILEEIPKNVNTQSCKDVYTWQDLKENLEPELYENIVEMATRYGYHVED